MGYECFDVEVAGKVAHLRMNRPEKRNSMIPAFWRELPEIVDGLSASGDVRAVVISSTGPHFTSGMDLSVFTGEGGAAPHAGRSHRSRTAERIRSMAARLQDSFTALERCRVPVLCAIQGGCIGGGVDFVSAADLRYADASAFFVIQEINIGMTADVGTLQRMPKLVPPGIVAELAYTGRRWSVTEAATHGFVNAVFDDHDALVAGTLEVAAEIATKSPVAVWGTKQTMRFARDHSVADGLEYIAAWNAGMFDSDDMAEAFAAKAEGGEPDFPDLPPLAPGL